MESALLDYGAIRAARYCHSPGAHAILALSEWDDLRIRLARSRWTDENAGSGWDQGADLHFLKELCEYWREGYDWKLQVEKLSSWQHFRANPRIHFIHERGKGDRPLPLVLTHGWPGSFVEMLRMGETALIRSM